MQKLLIVSKRNGYTEQLTQAAYQMGIEVCALCSTQKDLLRFLDSQVEADLVICTDQMDDGLNVSQCASILIRNGYFRNLFYVIGSTQYSQYLNSSRIRYVMNTDCTPKELLEMIQEAMYNETRTPEKNYSNSNDNPVSNVRNRQGNPNAVPVSPIQNQEVPAQRTPTANYSGMPKQGQPSPQGFRPCTITINSPKGGVGKTSLAIELSSVIAKRAKDIDFNPNTALQRQKHIQVCLVDLNASFDTMASSLRFVRERPDYPTVINWVNAIEEKIYRTMTPAEKERLRQDENYDFSPYIREGDIIFTSEEIYNLLVHDDQTGLFVLPSASLPFDVEYVKPEYIRIMLKAIKSLFDVVVIDTGNNISFFTVEAMRAADEIFLVSAPTYGSVTVMGKLTKNISRLKLNKDRISLVVNYPNGSDSELDPIEIAKALKLPLISVLPFDEGIRESHEHGEPYSCNTRKSRYANEITKLAQQVIPLWAVKTRSPVQTKPRKKGVLSRFFG